MSMAVGSLNNVYTRVTRTILFQHEREPITSLKEMVDAATKIPTTKEKNDQIDAPMQGLKKMKDTWLL
jgi:hypothetical protein